MNQPNGSNTHEDRPSGQAAQPVNAKRGGVRTGTIIGLAIVALLALGVAGYTAVIPHVVTVTQQQVVTNVLNAYNTQTVTSVNQVTQMVTVTNTQATTGAGYVPSSGSYQYCSIYGCMYPPGANYNTYNPYNPPTPWRSGYYNGVYYGYWYGNFVQPCLTTGLSNSVTCSGYIFQAQNGCTILVIPIAGPNYGGSLVYQYYSLRNLPTNVPSNGSWVTVSGQLYQGANTSTSGASCPGNYISVTSL